VNLLCLFNEVFSNTAIKSGHHRGEGNLWVSKGGFSTILQEHSFPLAQLYPLTLEALGIDLNADFLQDELDKIDLNKLAN
jgi:hypothetical protein